MQSAFCSLAEEEKNKKQTQMTKNPHTAFIFNRLQLCELIWAYFPREAKT